MFTNQIAVSPRATSKATKPKTVKLLPQCGILSILQQLMSAERTA
jgi:hypothetical protein